VGLVEIRVSCGNMEVGLSGSRDQSGNLIGGVKECSGLEILLVMMRYKFHVDMLY